MGVGAGLYMYDVVGKSSRSLSHSHLLMSSCLIKAIKFSAIAEYISIHIVLNDILHKLI